jgi:hypothetical protein
MEIPSFPLESWFAARSPPSITSPSSSDVGFTSPQYASSEPGPQTIRSPHDDEVAMSTDTASSKSEPQRSDKPRRGHSTAKKSTVSAKRRVQNREAAARFRQKELDKLSSLMEAISHTERDNNQLATEKDIIAKEVAHVKSLLDLARQMSSP